jgi:probable rRNA maturation factor
MPCTVEVQIDPSLIGRVDAGWIAGVVREALSQEETPGADSELTIVITDDESIQALNRRYRGVDSPTDVLSFGGEAEGFVEAPGRPLYWGDVVISYPRAEAQATEQGHSIDQELALLVIHGVLHLLGYDHGDSDEEAIMWACQGRILSRVTEGLAPPR